MRIAIVTFDGFNEIDSFLALNILNRVQRQAWKAEICCAGGSARSANGVVVTAQQPLEFANDADAVIVGSGRLTRQIADDTDLLARLRLDPNRQLIGSQCSGALILSKLGLLGSQPVCTDRSTMAIAQAAGIEVLDRPFHVRGNVATAGGCLSAHYLAAWQIWRLADQEAAETALSYVVPVGEGGDYIARAIRHVRPFIAQTS